MDMSPPGLWSRATDRPNFCSDRAIYYVGQPPGQCSQFDSCQKALWFHILWINGCIMSRCSSWDSLSYISLSAHFETPWSLRFVTHLPNPSYVFTGSHIVYLMSLNWIKHTHTMGLHVSRVVLLPVAVLKLLANTIPLRLSVTNYFTVFLFSFTLSALTCEDLHVT